MDLKTLTDADKGRTVIWDRGTKGRCKGVLDRWTEQTAFVRFKGSDFTSACNPDNVEFA